MTGGAPLPAWIGWDGLPLRDKFHDPALCLEPLNAALQEHLGAPHWDGLLKDAVGQVPESVSAAVDAHEPLGAIVVSRDFFVGDRPSFEISRTESQAVTRPAQRAPSQRLQQSVAGTVSNSGEVIVFGKIQDAGERTAMTCPQALFQLSIGGAVSVVI